MLRVTLRGLRAHKVRLVATAVAVLLGVAFMAGTQVLTSSVSASFDKVFADVYASIDVVVRSSTEVDTPFGSQRSRVDASLLPTIEGIDGVTAAEGQVVAQIRVLDKAGKPLVSSQGPPNFGLNWLTSPALNGWTIVDGAPPTGPTDIVLDAKTAADGGYAGGRPGQRVGHQRRAAVHRRGHRPVREARHVGRGPGRPVRHRHRAGARR